MLNLAPSIRATVATSPLPFQAKRIHEKVERHVEELREKGELPARKVLLRQFVLSSFLHQCKSSQEVLQTTIAGT